MLKLQGQALISTHAMNEADEDARSVWVILDHTEDATTLFCLNRALEPEVEIDIRQHLPHIPEGLRLLRGGSMDGFDRHMVFAHRDPLKIEPYVDLADKFRISMKTENVHQLTDLHAPNCRIVLGFDTWNPHELEAEIRAGLWVLRDMSHVGATFFKVAPEELWSRLQAN